MGTVPLFTCCKGATEPPDEHPQDADSGPPVDAASTSNGEEIRNDKHHKKRTAKPRDSPSSESTSRYVRSLPVEEDVSYVSIPRRVSGVSDFYIIFGSVQDFGFQDISSSHTTAGVNTGRDGESGNLSVQGVEQTVTAALPPPTVPRPPPEPRA